MKIMASFLAAAALLTYSTEAVASDWWFVTLGGQKPDRQISFLDTSSTVNLRNGVIRAWSSTYFESAETKTSEVKYDKKLNEYDCNARTMRLISWADYDSNGRLINSTSLNTYQQNVVQVIPDSIGDDKMQFVCKDLRDNSIHVGQMTDVITAGKTIIVMLDNLEK
ncbi:hypothetical protein E2E30_17780 [Sphingomonas sp. AAP5]|uniref:surface-adhesin E family protein n=1 Tax=Sphingomonas sp. AAP5 TaxID=1523415 RepID=UPI00105707A5|nr:surface-adhesin E family protein [Sphingomonas sp. AAP5]QBM77411.1 hypothetical protein E2E30_17780 [Sphingomonas sp. AAP5]